MDRGGPLSSCPCPMPKVRTMAMQGFLHVVLDDADQPLSVRWRSVEPSASWQDCPLAASLQSPSASFADSEAGWLTALREVLRIYGGDLEAGTIATLLRISADQGQQHLEAYFDDAPRSQSPVAKGAGGCGPGKCGRRGKSKGGACGPRGQ